MGFDVATLANVVITGNDRTTSAWESVRANADKTANSIQAFSNKIMGPFLALQGAVAAVGAAVGAVKFLDFVNEVAESAAALDRMAQVTGSSAANLSALASVAKLSNTDLGTVENAMTKLAKGMAGADDETKGFGAALSFLGLSAKDANGNLKPTDAMLLEIALKMEKYRDGAGKTALAQAEFGKAGAQMIPVLHDLAIVGQYNAKITDDQATAARQYEEDLKRLSAVKSSLSKQIALEVIPAFDAVVKTLLDLYKTSGGVRDELGKLAKDGSIRNWADSAAMTVAKFVDESVQAFYSLRAIIAGVVIGFDSLFEHTARLATGGIANPISQRFAKQLEDDQKYLAQLKQDAAAAQGHYAKLLGQNLALGRISISNADRNDRGQAWYQNLLPKPEAKFNSANASGATASDDVLKRIAALKEMGLLEKALYEAGQAVYKATINQELADLRSSLGLRLVSEQQWLEQDSALRTALAEADAEKASNEATTAVDTLAKMYEEMEAIRGKDAQDAARLRVQAQREIDAQSIKVVQSLAAEEVARINVNETIKQGVTAMDLYKQKIEDQMRASREATEDFVRSLDDQTAAEQAELALMGATQLQRDMFNSQLKVTLQLRAMEIQYMRTLREYERTGKDIELIDELGREYLKEVDAVKATGAAHLAILPVLDQQRQRIDNLRSAWQAIDSTAFDVFKSIFEHGSDTWKKLTDSLKSTLIRALYEMTIQRWTLRVFADITGTAGAGIVQSAQQGGVVNSASSLLNTGTSAYSALTGASGLSAGASIGAGATGYAGFAASSAGQALGLSAAATTAEGVAITELTALGAAIPVIGWVVAAAALIYTIFSANKTPTPTRGGLSFTGPFEDNVAPTHTAFGDIGFADAATQQFSGQVGKIMTDAIGTALDLAAKQLKPETVTALSNTLHATILQSFEGTFTTEDFVNKFGPQMARQLLDPVLEAVDPYARKLVDAFDGPFDKLLGYAVDILTTTQALQDTGGGFKALFGQVVDLQALDAARQAGETFSGALQRLGQEFLVTNQIATMMGKSQETVWGSIGLASDKAREQLISFAGGLDKLNASLGSYYSHYYTAEEQLQHQHDALAQTFESLGVTMPQTLGGFRTLVENIVNGVNPALSLQTEAGRQLYTQLLAVETPFYNYITAVKNSGKAADEAAGTIQRATVSNVPMINGVPVALNGVGRAAADLGHTAADTAAKIQESVDRIKSVLAYWQPGGAGSSAPVLPYYLQQRNDAISQFSAGRDWASTMGIDNLVLALEHIDPTDFSHYSATDQALITNILTTQQKIEDYLRSQSSGGSSAPAPQPVQDFTNSIGGATSAVDQLAAELDRARQGMRDWLKSLGIDQHLSPLLPMQQFQQAQSSFVESILHFNRNDPNAYAAFQQTGSTFLNQALNVFPRAGQIYGDIFRFVQNSGQQLLAGQQVTELLNRILQEISVGSRMTTNATNNLSQTVVTTTDSQTRTLAAASTNPNKLQ